MKLRLAFFLSTAFAAQTSLFAASCVIMQDFNVATAAGLSSTYFKIAADSIAYSALQSDGRLHLTKAQGETSGGIKALSRFKLSGDFTITVEVYWEAGNNMVAGLFARGTNSSVAVYFTSSSRVYFNGCQGISCSGGYSSSPYHELRIDRIGSTVNAYIHDPQFSVPHWLSLGGRVIDGDCTVELSMFQERPELSSSQAASSCSFDNLLLDAANCPSVEVSTNAPPLHIAPAVQVCFDSEFGEIYQIQYADRVEATNWYPLIDNIAGNGNPRCYFLAATNSLTRFYRVVTFAQ